MSLMEARATLLDNVLGLMWAQWTELGVAGLRGSAHSIVDPEALLVGTLTFGRYDPRLFDEVLDWLTLNAEVLDTTRFRRLAGEAPPDVTRLAGAVVEFTRERSSRRGWPGSVERLLAREEANAWDERPLFMLPDDSPLPERGERDELFTRHGFSRDPARIRGMSAAPDPRRPSLLRLRTRALVGTGVRSEVLVYLGTHESAHGRLIAERSSFAQRQVAEYLVALADAGHAERWEAGRRVEYRLSLEARALVGAEGSRYVDWSACFGFLRLWWYALGEALQASGAYEASVRLRDAAEEVREAMPAEGVEAPRPDPARHPGAALVAHAEEFTRALSRWFAEVEG